MSIHVRTCFLFAFGLIFSASAAFSQKLPLIRSSVKIIDIHVGKVIRKSSWNIDASIKPDVFDVAVPKNGTPVTFVTDQDSIRFDVKPGDYYEFIILLNGKDSALTAIKSILDVPRAQFSDDYKKSHAGKTFVEIPPVYELINVVFALTDKGNTENGMIRKSEPYYAEVLNWFEKYKSESVVGAINAALKEPDNYHSMKMDAYAFEYENGKIKQSPVYDRIGFGNNNNLRPYIADLEQFATKSKFSDFYKQHKPLYDGLITSYRDSIGVPEMQKWLTKNFPSTKYDSFKIIFSPLVNSNQSATWFEYDGFKEAQAHVNFPFHKKDEPKSVSKEASLVRDGSIVFTELNHAFINPESEKPEYATRIAKAFTDIAKWNNLEKPAKYYNNAFSSFNEYMNWALVCIRYVDYAPEKDQAELIAQTENMMVNSRGFQKFAEFDQFLVKLYKNRKKGHVLADLYPEIVAWFEGNG
ncbi:DUF4932 domain-containing protein [Dyadobacter sp. CY326]|uniref:DUF4932 domain-containing protein n=1 Tax=Dyadobacter sp. CY326 TaxID=2907300 RepID=UPI001F2EC713|nr:DUF4932 domain-containing protein [Dyadobacter sp. CY326]MCE7066105.1 DUF4932 domain-containing protein [Dyadobacter sp. CY326]